MTRWHKGTWHKGVAEWIDGDVVNLSIVFTWDVADAWSRAVFWKQQGYHVRAGGPGVFVKVMREKMSEVAEVGTDYPDAVTRHNPMATFASRGCPVGCYFCIVPAMEGRDFTLIDNFRILPVLCDNNLSALPEDFQDHIVSRYQREAVPLLDANSGFEPRTFTEDTYRRWEPILRGPWRFALDDQGDLPHVERMMKILADVSPKRKQVYTLIGNEPFDQCMDRIKSVIAWGGEPYAQPVMKLSAKAKTPWIRHDWNLPLLRRVQRWCNRRLWKYAAFEDYNVNIRTQHVSENQLALDL